MSPDDIRQQIELQVVELIKAKLADGTMTDERSQQISERVLEILKPSMTLEELFRAIPKLDDNCPELSPLILPLLRDYEQNVAQKAVGSVRDLIKLGQYDAAVKLGQKTVTQDVELQWSGQAKASTKAI